MFMPASILKDDSAAGGAFIQAPPVNAEMNMNLSVNPHLVQQMPLWQLWLR